MAGHTLTARTYVNADRSKVVKEGSPEAAFLLGGEGDEVDEAEAERLGLGGKKAPAEDNDEPKPRKP